MRSVHERIKPYNSPDGYGIVHRVMCIVDWASRSDFAGASNSVPFDLVDESHREGFRVDLGLKIYDDIACVDFAIESSFDLLKKKSYPRNEQLIFHLNVSHSQCIGHNIQ